MFKKDIDNTPRRYLALAALPVAALLVGSSAAFANNPPGQSNGIRAIGGTGIDAIGGTGIDAIGGTGVDAIGGTGVDAIGGTGVDAIGGTGVDAIGGTGVDAIGGTGVDAIGGTGVAAIGGTGRTKGRAIGGTGIDAIGGTGVDAIGGTGIDAIGGTGVDAIGGTGIDAIGGTGRSQLLILGPIELVDGARRTITILGRKLQLPSGPAGARIVELYAAGAPIQLAVLGTLSTDGKIDDLRIRVVATPYVAGVSEVVLTGVMQAVNQSTGQGLVNGIHVDFTSLLETNATTMSAGTVVTVRGTMPQAGQAISASVLVLRGH